MKNLIYYSFNESYSKLFDLHLKSLDRFANGSFDFKIVDSPNKTPFEASANKLKIYRADLSGYDNILYCDVDTIWNKSPNDIFNAISEGKINTVNENQLMNHPAGYWGDYLLSFEQRADITSKNILGINGGIFGFKSNMKHVLKEVETFMQQHESKYNALYEQPFLNAYLYSHDLIDNSLNDFVSNSYDGTGNKHLIHFLGGDKQSKLDKMKNYANGK